MTPEPVLVLWSDPVADPILLRNILSYPHCSKCTLLPLALFHCSDPSYQMQGHEDTVIYRLFSPGVSSNSLRNLLEVSCNIFYEV